MQWVTVLAASRMVAFSCGCGKLTLGLCWLPPCSMPSPACQLSTLGKAPFWTCPLEVPRWAWRWIPGAVGGNSPNEFVMQVVESHYVTYVHYYTLGAGGSLHVMHAASDLAPCRHAGHENEVQCQHPGQ